MEFKKITISLPKSLYDEGMNLVHKGMFSNFSDLVRSGIREEFKELQPVMQDFDERMIYSDKELITGVSKSRAEAKAGRGKKISTDSEMDKYLEEL